ncbi:MAG: glycoside hydrolase family 31 protein [Elusimicrobia bacterium]|nr:glycoside hydrolase family 31 protein [Elusimicrobiota bacterium]
MSVRKNIVIFKNARFSILSNECIRLEYSEDSNFIDEPSMFAINRNIDFREYKSNIKNNKLTIETNRFKLTYLHNGHSFSANNLEVIILNGNKKVIWKPGMKNIGNLGGTLTTLDTISDEVDLNEGLLSRDGWYLLDDTENHLFKDGWVTQKPNKNNTDWYLFAYGTDFKSALKSMTLVAGKVPIPRKYALGAWYSRYWPYTSKEYREIVGEYKKYDFPLDIMVLDMLWHRKGWTGWSWDRKLLPDAERLLKWFHKQNIYTTLNVHPADGIQPHEDMYKAFMKDMGQDYSKGETIRFDAGNKHYLDKLFKHTHTPLEKYGVDFWWLDWQQHEFTDTIPDLTNLKILNYYYFKHTEKNNKRGLSFSRWAGWGDHRHPIQFSGDAHADWPMLKFEVPFTATAGNVGCFFWSHDTGGHFGDRNEECYTRWVQFSAMSATLRSHSTRDPDLDRRPWTYSKKAMDSMRISFHLRSIIFPYIYSSVWQCYNQSLPLIRPLYIEYPENENSYKNPQEYLFGDLFLVAPVASQGRGPGKIALQNVYFPEGPWYNWFTGEKYCGESDTISASDINEFPLYVKGGVPIPIQHYTPRMTTTPLKELVLRCYPGENGKIGKYSLYEDDGITEGYLKGKHAITDLEYNRVGNKITVTINPAKGNYKGQAKKRSYIIELPCTEKCREAIYNDKPIKTEYDNKTFTNRIYIPQQSLTKKIIIRVEVKELNPDILSKKALARRIKGLLNKDYGNTSLQDIVVDCLLKKTDKEVLETLLTLCNIRMQYKQGFGLILYNNSKSVDKDIFNVIVTDYCKNKVKTLLNSKFKVSDYLNIQNDNVKTHLAQPELGFSSKREIQIGFKVKKYPVTIKKIIEQKQSYLTKWNVLGPFPFNREQPLSEQNFGTENVAINLNAGFRGLDSKLIYWQKFSNIKNNSINLMQPCGFGRIMAYMATFIYSKKKQNILLRINSDSKFEFWHNSKKIYEQKKVRFFGYDPDIISLVMEPGDNELLIKFAKTNLGLWTIRVKIETKYPVKEFYGPGHKHIYHDE